MKHVSKIIILLIAIGFLFFSTQYTNNTQNKVTYNEEEKVEELEFIENNSNSKLPSFLSEGNLKHILQGGINRRGEATGFHHLPSAKDTNTKILQIINQENNCGVYKAKVSIEGKTKKAFSSMFPNKLTKEELVDIISKAYNKGRENFPTSKTLKVKTDNCFEILIAIDNNKKIITAYPLY
jgi:Bacterial EndoU nuclease